MVKQKMRKEGINLMVLALWLGVSLVLMSTEGIEAYQNYTVGDSLGWYDNSTKPSINYLEWATGKNFSLGDFLIFNTDTNHSVVQTYNQTTYQSCDYGSDDSIEWTNAEPSANVTLTTVSVPLIRVGANYFFSGDDDGWQCANASQKFQINVTYGQGLPPSLLVPPAAPPPPTTNAPPTDTPPTTDTASTSDTAARIDGLFLALTLTLMLSLRVIW